MKSLLLLELLLDIFEEEIKNNERRKRARNFFNIDKCDSPRFNNGTPRDDNKIFGVNIRVDEPRAQDYTSRREFLRDHHNFDELINAAEKCNWKNKSNDAPLHRVDAVRKRLDEGPVIGKDLIGETCWWW